MGGGAVGGLGLGFGDGGSAGVRALCAPSARRAGALVPVHPLVCAEVARRLSADGRAVGFVEVSGVFGLRVDVGRYRFSGEEDLRGMVREELPRLGEEMRRAGAGLEGCGFVSGGEEDDSDGPGGSGGRKVNAEWATAVGAYMVSGSRMVSDVAREVGTLLPRASLFGDFGGGVRSEVPCLDGVWNCVGGERGEGALRPYLAEDRFLSWLPLAWGGGVNDCAVRCLEELCGAGVEDVLDALAEGLVMRRKEVALLLYGPDGGEGKTTAMSFYEGVVGTAGAVTPSSAVPCRGNVLDDDRFLFGDADAVHPSVGYGFVGCSAMLLPDLADRGKVNLSNLVKVVAGSYLPVREMHKSFASSGLKVPVQATLVAQSNSLLGMDGRWSASAVERRILGVRVEPLSEGTLRWALSLDAWGREEASRGLLRALLERLGLSGGTWRGSDSAWTAWRRLLFEETPGAQSVTDMVGLTWTGDRSDILFLTGLYGWCEARGEIKPSNLFRNALDTHSERTVSFKTPVDKRVDGMPARVTYVRGWTCSVAEAVCPGWLYDRATRYDED